MLNQSYDDVTVDRPKSLSFFQHYYILLKAHYFLCYSSFASIGPLNITLRSRGLSNSEISYINLVIPFLVFFTNPLLGFFIDHTRRFRLTFNVILSLAIILILVIFFLPSIKTHSIHAEIHQTGTMEYSMVFCANEDFATKCTLRSQCGCAYQATCTPLITTYHFNGRLQVKTFHFNFTMNSTDVEKEVKNLFSHSNKRSECDINYRVSVNEIIAQYTKDEIRNPSGNIKTSSANRNIKLASCEIECSIDHICDASRHSNQIIYILLYSFLIVIALNLFANATTIGTSIGFATLHHSNLFGRQRVWGTIGAGITAFVISRLYVHFNTEYVYISMFIVTGVLSIIVTSFIRLQSEQGKSQDSDVSVIENLNDSPVNQTKEERNAKRTKMKNNSFNIRALLPLMKKIDVIVFLVITFIWGMSTGAIDPYLLLYIDEISPCESRSIVGYMALITATVEVVALFVANKLLKRLGTKICAILIFVAFVIRFFGYYFNRRPYFLLPLETMHFFNFGILFVLIAQEAFTIAPPDLAGTLQGIVYGISFGLGRGTGLLVSLLIYTRMKKRYLFLIYAIFNLVGTVIYLIYCLLGKRGSLGLTAPDDDSDNVYKSVLSKSETNLNTEPLLLSAKSQK